MFKGLLIWISWVRSSNTVEFIGYRCGTILSEFILDAASERVDVGVESQLRRHVANLPAQHTENQFTL